MKTKTSLVWDNRRFAPGKKMEIYHECRLCMSPLMSEQHVEGYCSSCKEEYTSDRDLYERWVGDCA